MLAFLASLALAQTPSSALSGGTLESRLTNGVRVAAHQVTAAEQVSLVVRVGQGSALDPPGKSGLGHLLEHMMFSGSPHAPDGAFERVLSAVGASTNGWTEHDATVYFSALPPSTLGMVAMLETDRLASLEGGLTEQTLAVERAAIEREVAEVWATPRARDAAAMNALLFPAGHSYQRPVRGVAMDRAGLTLSDVRKAHTSMHRADAISVAVVGPEEPSVMLETVTRWFARLPAASGRPVSTQGTSVSGPPRSGTIRDAARSGYLMLGWRTVSRGDPDEAALDVLTRLLSQSASPPEGVQLTDSWSLNGRDGGVFVVEFRLESTPTRRDVRRVRRTVRRAPVSTRTAAQASQHLRDRLLTERMNPERIAMSMAECMDRGLPADCLAGEGVRYQRVSPERVKAVRRRWLSSAPAVLVVIGDEEELVPPWARELDLQ